MGAATVALVLLATVGSGVAAGVFYAFSTYVMPALARLPASQGIATMNAINVAAPRPFTIAQAGTAAISLGAVVAVLLDWDAAYGWYVIAAAAIYVLSVVVLTGGYHVPRNNELARYESADRGGAEVWSRYLREWTAMNHLRALAPAVACGLDAAALYGS